MGETSEDTKPKNYTLPLRAVPRTSCLVIKEYRTLGD